jgi:hypothetical protein
MRRRRSALLAPAFVDRMELPEDSEDRVAVFGVEAGSPEPTPGVPGRQRPERSIGMSAHVAAALDSRYAAPALAALLVVVLVLGMLLLKR